MPNAPFSPESPSKRRKISFFSRDLLTKLGAFVFSAIVIWFIYSAYVWPEAQDIAITTRLRVSQDPDYISPRSVAVIVKDPEQQWEIVLWLWATILMGLKLRRLGVENRMLNGNYLRLEPGERILPDDSLAYYKDLQGEVESRRGWRERILPNVILASLHRFHATRSIPDAAQSIKERSDVAADELEADLSLIRYIVWAIPSLGFIGTVRGIGEALAQAQKALAGDISGVTDALGLAFNSTLVALLLSLVLMFLLHLLQARQDKLMLDIQNFCHDHVVDQMKIPSQESGAPAFQV
ncbi:MAG: MotA/TolQ/ExbB proton channel family protein [Opitutaceae bacterium]